MADCPTDFNSVTDDVVEKYRKHVNPTQVALLKIAGFDRIEHEATGTTVTDLDGNSYIDCLGGYGVFSLGHRHPKVVAAVKRQLELMPMSSKTFLNKPLADLCARLASIAPVGLDFSFLCNSGAEAVEAALKFARMATGRHEIVACEGGFHGKTMGALSATGREVFRRPFEPLIAGVSYVAWDDLDAAKSAITDRCAAVIVEPVQGEGGIRVPGPDYLRGLRALCEDAGALLILDEIQTGLGRTGKMFACEHSGVRPDLMTLAKALGGGVMPIGALMGTAAIWDKVLRENPFLHTSTFGGNELACVAALATLDVLEEENLAERAAQTGAYFIDRLRQVQSMWPELLIDVRGVGLMIGIEFSDADIAKIVIGALVHEGVIAAYTLNNPSVIRMEPPLIISRSEIDTVTEALGRGLEQASSLLALLTQGDEAATT